MHPNPLFRNDDRALHEALIEEIGFGMVFAQTADGPRVAHTPLLSTGDGAVQFHVSRGNALTKYLAGQEALVVLNGPDGYVSPRWYDDPAQVPTWNYVALELQGPVRRMTEDGLVGLLDALSARHEARIEGEPWTRAKMDDAIFRKMLGAIAGFEMEARLAADLQAEPEQVRRKPCAGRRSARSARLPRTCDADADLRRMSVRLAVFDCDGTLSDGQAAVCAAMERAFGDCGLVAPPSHQVRRIVGLSLPVAMRHLAPNAALAQHGRLVDAYKQAFFDARSRGQVSEPLFDGMAELLRALHAKGWQLGVATGKSDRGLHGCLTTHGVHELFVTLQTADRHPSKPDPAMLEAAMAEAGAAPDETVMIGDTTWDIEMARAAGVRAIGVAWGYHAPEELIAAGAEAVAATAADLQEMIDG